MSHLSIASPKGGVGKTMLALQLAAAFSKAGLRVNLIDHDPQGSALVFGKIAQKAGRILPFALTNAQTAGFDLYLHDHAPGVVERYPSEVLVMPVVLDAPSGSIHRRGKTLLAERGYATLEVVSRFRSDRAEPRKVLAAHYAGCPVIRERTLYSNLYGRGLTVFDAPGVPYLDRAQEEIVAVRKAVERLLGEMS